MNPEYARFLSDWYAENPELIHVINQLKTALDEDSFHKMYLWIASAKWLYRQIYLVDASPARSSIPSRSMCLTLPQGNHDWITTEHPIRNRRFWKLWKTLYWSGRGKRAPVKLTRDLKSIRTKTGLLQPLLLAENPLEKHQYYFQWIPILSEPRGHHLITNLRLLSLERPQAFPEWLLSSWLASPMWRGNKINSQRTAWYVRACPA